MGCKLNEGAENELRGADQLDSLPMEGISGLCRGCDEWVGGVDWREASMTSMLRVDLGVGLEFE